MKEIFLPCVFHKQGKEINQEEEYCAEQAEQKEVSRCRFKPERTSDDA